MSMCFFFLSALGEWVREREAESQVKQQRSIVMMWGREIISLGRQFMCGCHVRLLLHLLPFVLLCRQKYALQLLASRMKCIQLLMQWWKCQWCNCHQLEGEVKVGHSLPRDREEISDRHIIHMITVDRQNHRHTWVKAAIIASVSK